MSTPKTVPEWADRLKELLTRAGKAAASGDAEKIRAAQDELDGFIENSPASAAALHRVARLAVIDLHAGHLGQVAESLQSRNDEVDRLRELIAGVSKDNRRRAESLRLERVTGAVAQTTKTVESLKGVLETLKKNDSDKALGERITELIGEIQSLRDELELD